MRHIMYIENMGHTRDDVKQSAPAHTRVRKYITIAIQSKVN